MEEGELWLLSWKELRFLWLLNRLPGYIAPYDAFLSFVRGHASVHPLLCPLIPQNEPIYHCHSILVACLTCFNIPMPSSIWALQYEWQWETFLKQGKAQERAANSSQHLQLCLVRWSSSPGFVVPLKDFTRSFFSLKQSIHLCCQLHSIIHNNLFSCGYFFLNRFTSLFPKALRQTTVSHSQTGQHICMLVYSCNGNHILEENTHLSTTPVGKGFSDWYVTTTPLETEETNLHWTTE